MTYSTSLTSALSSAGSNRDDAITDNVNGLTIDTCYAPDTGEWETGIKKDGQWNIVEHYGNDREKAKEKHEEWCEIVRENPDDSRIKDCDDIKHGL